MLPQTAEWVNFPTAERRFLQNSAEDQRFNVCRDCRLTKIDAEICRLTLLCRRKKKKSQKRLR